MPQPATFDDLGFTPAPASFDDLGFSPVDSPSPSKPTKPRGLAISDSVEGIESPSTFNKARYAMAGAASSGIADVLTGLGRMADIVEPSVKGIPDSRFGTRMASALGRPFRERGEAAETVAEATPGNKIVAAIGSGIGSIVPTALAALFPPAAIPAAGLQTYGGNYLQAKEYLTKLGVEGDEADRLANRVGLATGAFTAAVTKYMPDVLSKVPVIGKYIGDRGVEAWTKRFLVDELKAQPGLAEAAKRITGSMVGEGIEEGTDQAFQAAIDKKTSRPDLTWTQALAEVGLAGLAGGVSAGLLKGPMELGRVASGQDQRDAAAEAAKRGRGLPLQPTPTTIEGAPLLNVGVATGAPSFVQNLRPEPGTRADVFPPTQQESNAANQIAKQTGVQIEPARTDGQRQADQNRTRNLVQPTAPVEEVSAQASRPVELAEPVVKESLTTPVVAESATSEKPLDQKQNALTIVTRKLDALEKANDNGEPADGLADARSAYQRALLERDVELYKVLSSEDLLRRLRDRATAPKGDAFNSERVRQIALELYRRGENPATLLEGKLSPDEAEVLKGDLEAIKSTLNETRAPVPAPAPVTETAAGPVPVATVAEAEAEAPEAGAAAGKASPILDHWRTHVEPALHDFFKAADSFGIERLERNRIKPAGTSLSDWIQNVAKQQATWDRSRKTGVTGLEMLKQKNLWPTEGPEGEVLRKAMLKAVQELKRAPGSRGDWISSQEQSATQRTGTPATEAPKPEAAQPPPAAGAAPAATVTEQVSRPVELPSRQTPREGTPERDAYDAKNNAAFKVAEEAYAKSSEMRDAANKAKYGSAKKDKLTAQAEAASDAYSKAKPAADDARASYQLAGLEDLAEKGIPISSEYAQRELEAKRILSEPDNPSARKSKVERARDVRESAYQIAKEQIEKAYEARGLTPKEAAGEALNHLSSFTSYPLAEGDKMLQRLDRMAEVVKEQRQRDILIKEFDAVESPVKGNEQTAFRRRVEDKYGTIPEAEKALAEYKAWAEAFRERLAIEDKAKADAVESKKELITAQLQKTPSSKFTISDYGENVLIPGDFVSNGRMMMDMTGVKPAESKRFTERPMQLGRSGVPQKSAVDQMWLPTVGGAKGELQRVGYRTNDKGVELVYFVDPKTNKFWALDRAYEGLIDRAFTGKRKVMGDTKTDKNSPLVFYNDGKPAAIVMPFTHGEGVDINAKRALEPDVAPSLLPSGTPEAATNLRTGRSFMDPSTPEARRLPLWWQEVAVHGGLQSALVQGQARIEIDRLVGQADRFLQAEADALAQAAGFADAAALRQSYGFAEGPAGDAAMRWELLSRKAEELAGKEKPSWWRNLIGQIQLWLAKHFNFNLSASGVEALIRVGAKNMQGVELETAVIGKPDGTSDLVYSLANSPQRVSEIAKLSPDIDPADKQHIYNRMWAENNASVGPIVEQFEALPGNVKRELEPISNHINSQAAARQLLEGNVPRGTTLQEIAYGSTEDPNKRADIMLQGARSIATILDHEATLENRITKTTEALTNAVEVEKNTDQVERAKTEIVNSTLRSLMGSRSMATDPLDRMAYQSEIDYLRKNDGALKVLTKAVVDLIPEEIISGPGTNRATTATWIEANADAVRGSQSKALVPIFVSLVRDTPDVNQLLRVAKGTDLSAESKTVADLRADLDAKNAALNFIRSDVRNNPTFAQSYQQAVDFADISERLTGDLIDPKTGKVTEIYRYPNPYNREQFADIRPDDLSQENWERNREQYEKALVWYRAFALDTTQDPAKRAAAAKAIPKIELEMNQSVAPEMGRVTPEGTLNPFYLAMRGAMGLADIPRATLEFIGGRMALKALQNLYNRALVSERMANVHKMLRGKVFAKVLDAARAAKFKGSPNQAYEAWREQIGDPILRSYQTQNDRRYKVGQKINGHVITPIDMEALRAMKDYAGAQLKAVQSMWRGAARLVSGIVSPLRVQEKIGSKTLEREAVDFTGYLMPLHYIKVRNAFEADLLNSTKDAATVVDQPEYWMPVFSHVQSYSDSDYRRQNPSPFVSEYQQIARDVDATGNAPKNLDELANRIFELRNEDADAEPMSVPEIKEQFITEIRAAFRAWKTEYDGQELLVQDSPDVSVSTADNFLNRPRGERLLPKGCYTYAVGTEESMYGIQQAALDLYGHRFLHDGWQLFASLKAKEAQFMAQKRNQAETQKLVQDGHELLTLNEARRFGAMLERSLYKFREYQEHAQQAERDLTSGVNMVRGWLASTLLSRFGPLFRNYAGGVVQRSLMDTELYRDMRNVMQRMWVVHPVIATAQAAAKQGQATVQAISGMLGNTEKGKRIRDAIRRNPKLYAQWVGQIQQYVDRQSERLARQKELGIVNEAGAVENFLNQWKLMSQRGRITADVADASALRKGLRSGAALVEMAMEVGVPLVNLPRSLSSHLADNLVNTTAEMYVNDDLATLHTNAVSSLNNRKTLGIPADATANTLSPAEVFGFTGVSNADQQRALAALRGEFARAGISLDQYLLDFHAAVQRAKADKSTKNVSILTDAQRNSLVSAWATRLNKGTAADRPTLVTPAARLAFTFLGYGINQNAQMAKMLGKWSRDKRKFRLEGLNHAAYMLVALGLVGAAAYPITRWVEWLLYREEKPLKNLSDTDSVGDFASTWLRQSAPFLPVIGNMLNQVTGQITQQGGIGGSGVTLLANSLVNSVIQTVSKGFQTGDWMRPTAEFIRQWIPNSRVILNRLGFRDGLTNEAAMRAAVAANAPSSLEVQPYQQGGATKFSAINAEVTTVRNALSRSGGPDMSTVRPAREQGIQKLQAKGMDRPSAEKAFDAAVLASSPYRSAVGREPTVAERKHMLDGMNDTQREIVQTVESGRTAYAAAFDRPAPDFVRAERAPQGTAAAQGSRTAGVSGGGGDSGPSRSSGSRSSGVRGRSVGALRSSRLGSRGVPSARQSRIRLARPRSGRLRSRNARRSALRPPRATVFR